MKLSDSLPRYGALIEILKSSPYASAITLTRSVVDKGWSYTPRELHADIEQLREVFGVDILFHKGKDGYFIDESTEAATDRLLDFLGLSQMNEVASQVFKSSAEASPYVSYEHEGLWAGARWLPELLRAAREHRWVGFDYRKFDADQVKHYSLQPLLLKQYQGRWYLIGKQNDGGDRTFGIDRIEALKVRDQVFTPPADDPRTRFRHVVGLDHSRGVVETVRFSCDAVQALYLKTLPLHKSQRIIRDGAHETVFEVKVIPNYEFIQRILMMGARVKIIQPASLATEVYSHLTDAAKQYEDK